MKNYSLIAATCLTISILTADPKIIYPFNNNPIDVVIPCHDKDQRTLDLVIDGIKKNGQNVRRIITVSETKISNQAEWIAEEKLPFNKTDIALAIAHGDTKLAKQLLDTPKSRIGWVFQQIIKLYAPFVIPEISPNVLVLDADTIFLQPVDFMTENGEPFFNVGTEHHKPYFIHAAKLLDGPCSIKKLFPNYSGICHHMLLQRPVLEELFEKIEEKSGQPAWITLCSCIDLAEFYGSSMSEYEIYFNFIINRTDQAHIRLLKWANILFNISEIEHCRQQGYHYVSCHTYIG